MNLCGVPDSLSSRYRTLRITHCPEEHVYGLMRVFVAGGMEVLDRQPPSGGVRLVGSVRCCVPQTDTRTVPQLRKVADV